MQGTNSIKQGIEDYYKITIYIFYILLIKKTETLLLPYPIEDNCSAEILTIFKE